VRASVPFRQLLPPDTAPPDTADAAVLLDQAVASLAGASSASTDFFKLLVSVFAAEFRAPHNDHLRNFYIILPPLTLNFIEFVLTAKDQVAKGNTTDDHQGVLSDDGFILGVCYILTLLDQKDRFVSLHWFESVSEHYRAEMEKAQAPSADVSNSLSLKNMQRHKEEWSIMYYTLWSTMVFFNNADA